MENGILTLNYLFIAFFQNELICFEIIPEAKFNPVPLQNMGESVIPQQNPARTNIKHWEVSILISFFVTEDRKNRTP